MTIGILLKLIREQNVCKFEQLYDVITRGRENEDEEDYESHFTYEQQMKELIECCCQKDVVYFGNVAVLHNVSIELAKNNYYQFACMLLEKALKSEKCFANMELLADYLKYSIYSGESEIKTSEKYYERLQSIDKKLWNWRAFDFSIDYLLACSDTTGSKEDYLKHALELARIYRKQMRDTPHEDKALNALSEVYLKTGDIKKFERTLEEGSRLKKAPLCTLKWGDYLFKKGEYTEAKNNIIKCCKDIIGIENIINIGYPYVLSALTRIMELYECRENNHIQIENEFETELKLIEGDYQTAKRALGESNEQVKNLKVQIDVLKKQINLDDSSFYEDYDYE